MLNREQQAALHYQEASSHLRRLVDDGEQTGLRDFTDALIEAVGSFGQSELAYRQSERCAALNVHAGKAVHSAQLGARLNEKGLRTLERAHGALARFRKELQSFPAEGKLPDGAVDAVQREVREALADLELKAADVLKIDHAFAGAFELARTSGAGALPDYLQQHLAQLEKVRCGDDRGAVDNIPVWKIIAIVIAIGVFIWAFFRCSFFGGCSFGEGLAYTIIFWLAALVAKFC